MTEEEKGPHKEDLFRLFVTRTNLDVSFLDQESHDNLTSKIEEANLELVEVMNLIKSISRKERQIRGRISLISLKEKGDKRLTLCSPHSNMRVSFLRRLI